MTLREEMMQTIVHNFRNLLIGILHRQALTKIQVIDCGVGVSPEQKQAIFEKYEVGNIVLGVSQIGLGLSFCKMVIEAHQGSISVTDNQPKGAIFKILLDHA